jgi:hypothetical protein
MYNYMIPNYRVFSMQKRLARLALIEFEIKDNFANRKQSISSTHVIHT